MSTGCSILGGAVLAVLLAGYLAQHYLPPPKPRIIGIDLGTTFSCVGVFQPGTGAVDIFQDDEKHYCIPSVVAFLNDDVLIGYKAAARSEVNPRNTFHDAKRFIGKHFSEVEFLQEMQRYLFEMVLDSSKMAQFVVNQHGNQTLLSPSEVGALIIRRLKETAEKQLGMPATKCVISVPAEFDDEQRSYTKLAATLAGLEVLRIINEPTAAAMAYGLHKREGFQTIIVVDLGGGTLDVSLLYVQNGMFITQAMAGNNHLGGQDFNQRIFAHLLGEIQKDFGSLPTSAGDLQLLRNIVENAKINLTNSTEVEIDVTVHVSQQARPIEGSVRIHYTLTRKKFEELCADLFIKILEPIKSVLTAVELEPSAINDIVLVGGSTRIPRVRQIIAEFFSQQPHIGIDPDLAVVTGVAIQAGVLGGAWPLPVSAIETRTSVSKIRLT